MARLVVVTTPQLAVGYRLAGATALAAASSVDAEELVSGLMDDSDIAVIGVHGPYWLAFRRRLVRDLERRTLPVVIEIPAGAVAEPSGQRDRLVEMLRHAIGHRFSFRREEGAA